MYCTITTIGEWFLQGRFGTTSKRDEPTGQEFMAMTTRIDTTARSIRRRIDTCVLAGLFTISLASWASAVCPFNIDQSSAANSTRATTDGLLFLRYALGLPAVTPPVANATENASLTPAQVGTFVATNLSQLDIDGDGKFTIFDAQVIARYLMGFRGAPLTYGLSQLDFSARYGSAALQNFIDNGCSGLNDLADPRVVVWNAMNTQLALGTTAGVNNALQYMTETAVDKYTAALTAIKTDLPAVVASYSQIVPRVVGSDYAEYWVSRPLVGGGPGDRLIYPVTFLRVSDGSWRVDAM